MAELLAIAAALQIPPVLLLFGVGRVETAEILPGRHVSPFGAARWFSGETPIPGPDDEAYIASIADDWNFATDNPLAIYRAYAEAVAGEMDGLRHAQDIDELAAAADGEPRRDLANAAETVRDIAARCRADSENIQRRAKTLGLLPPGRARATAAGSAEEATS